MVALLDVKPLTPEKKMVQTDRKRIVCSLQYGVEVGKQHRPSTLTRLMPPGCPNMCKTFMNLDEKAMQENAT